jgi:hypothetical protein
MTRTIAILLMGAASAMAVWWYRTQQQAMQAVPSARGEVIYRNAPIAGD